MAAGFPPLPIFPDGIDSDYTLFLVHNTTEAALAEDNDPWSEEIVIEPREKTEVEIWADNGFANIDGELFYYDAVERDANDRVFKLKKCARNLGGNQTKFQKTGVMVRSFVVAEHHTQLRDGIILTEQFVGENFSENEETLDWRIRNLRAVPPIYDDFGCPDVSFHFTVTSSDPSTGTVAHYKLEIVGSYQEFTLDFGDGTTTSSIQEGDHTYPPNANIDPVVTFKNGNCQIVQTPVSRDKVDSPEPQAVTIQFDSPNFPDFLFPNITVTMPSFPEADITLPPFQFPCIDLSPFGISPVNLPSMILFTPSINLPSIIEFESISIPDFNFNAVISITPITLPSIIEIRGDFPPIPSVIEVHVPQISFPSISFPEANISVEVPSFPTISVEVPTFPNITVDVPSFPEISVSVFWGEPPLLVIDWADPPPIFVDWFEPPALNVHWDSPPTIPINWDDFPTLPIDWDGYPTLPVDWTGYPVLPVNWSGYPSLPVNWNGAPSVPINWSGAPAYIPISCEQCPDINVDWGSTPTVNVNWGTPPTVQVYVTVTCPSNVASMALADPMAALDAGRDLEVQYDVSGFPSEIRVIPPEIPNLRLHHDLPSEIFIRSPVIDAIKFEVPELRDIKILSPETQLTIEAIGIPEMIRLESTFSIPDRIELVVPVRIPDSIVLDASEIPDVIRIEGLPDVIRLEHTLPSFIQLKMPEKPEIELVYKGPPLPVQIELDIQKLIGNSDELQCVAIVPCKKS